MYIATVHGIETVQKDNNKRNSFVSRRNLIFAKFIQAYKKQVMMIDTDYNVIIFDLEKEKCLNEFNLVN